MAFLVEDGTGLALATSYISVAEFQTHNNDRGRAAGGIATADAQAACTRATDYVDKRFGQRFRGRKSGGTQGLQWPRLDAYDNAGYSFAGVPGILKKAVAEYAWIVANLERDLAPPVGIPFSTINPETGEAIDAGGLLEKTEEVGPIRDSRRFGDPGADRKVPFTSTGSLTQNLPEYPEAELWMEELITGRSREVLRG